MIDPCWGVPELGIKLIIFEFITIVGHQDLMKYLYLFVKGVSS